MLLYIRIITFFNSSCANIQCSMYLSIVVESRPVYFTKPARKCVLLVTHKELVSVSFIWLIRKRYISYAENMVPW